MALQTLLGIDIGTSSLKCVLIDAAGQLLASAFREYTADLPQPGWAEQNPDMWLDATLSAVREVMAQSGVDQRSIPGLSFSSQMHSTVFLDRDRRVIRPAILWLDMRSAPQVALLNHAIGRAQLATWIGNPVMPGFMLSSLLWVRDNEPEVWSRVAHVMLAKDYVRLRLTGELTTDFSDASSTAMLDVKQRTWCGELLQATRLSSEVLPPLRQATAVAGYLVREMAEAMTLPSGLPVACGAGVQEAQAIGNGIIRSGLLSSTIGTGGQLFTPINRYRSDPQLRIHTFCHAFPELWHWQAATLTAGAAWCGRIDTTTNWTVVFSVTTLSFVFADKNSEHYVLIPIVSVFCTFLLLMETRRYRFFDIWRSRSRMIEINFCRPMLDDSALAMKHWAETLAHDMNWKFSSADLKERGHWDEYQAANEEVFNHTSTKWAP